MAQTDLVVAFTGASGSPYGVRLVEVLLRAALAKGARGAYGLAWALFAGSAAFAISYTGRVSFYRRIFFSVCEPK